MKNIFHIDKKRWQGYFTSTTYVYMLKCILGVIICFLFYVTWPEYPFNWALVSVVIGLSLDNSNKQAIDRVISNLIGCGVGLLLYPIPCPELLILVMGVIIIITLGFFFTILSTIRSALSAFLIVTLQAQKLHLWYIPLERVLCVTSGCVVAFLLTIFFNLPWSPFKQLHTKKRGSNTEVI